VKLNKKPDSWTPTPIQTPTNTQERRPTSENNYSAHQSDSDEDETSPNTFAANNLQSKLESIQSDATDTQIEGKTANLERTLGIKPVDTVDWETGGERTRYQEHI
jgi:hypothetical protein